MRRRLLVQLPGRQGNQVIAFLASQYVARRLLLRSEDIRYSRTLNFLDATLVGSAQTFGLHDGILCRLGGGHTITGHHVKERELADSRHRILIMKGYFQNVAYFFEPFHEFFSRRAAWAAQSFGRSVPDLTIHVRAGDIWARPGTRVHPDYPALPLSYYRQVQAAGPWRDVVVLTDEPNHPHVQSVARLFQAQVQSESPQSDLVTLARSRNIVLSVSTFALLGALASRADKVYFPRAGLFDRRAMRLSRGSDSPDLLPRSAENFIVLDAHYPEPWRGSTADLRALLNS